MLNPEFSDHRGFFYLIDKQIFPGPFSAVSTPIFAIKGLLNPYFAEFVNFLTHLIATLFHFLRIFRNLACCFAIFGAISFGGRPSRKTRKADMLERKQCNSFGEEMKMSFIWWRDDNASPMLSSRTHWCAEGHAPKHQSRRQPGTNPPPRPRMDREPPQLSLGARRTDFVKFLERKQILPNSSKFIRFIRFSVFLLFSHNFRDFDENDVKKCN